MKLGLLLKSLLLTIATLHSNFSIAALISADLDLGTGDEYLTIDSSQKLEFLDLTLTNGLSPIDITNGSVSFFDNGFRYATRLEVANLFSESGLFFDGGGYYAENYESANTLLNLLGILCCNSPTFDSALGIYFENGIYEFGAFSSDHSNMTAQISHHIGNVSPSSSNQYWGHFLVRESSSSSTTVPEPGSAFLLLAGVALLVSRKYRIN